MKAAAKSLLSAALRLPEADRVELPAELVAHLDGGADEDVDAAWAAEIDRRTREIERGIVKPIPWSAVERAAARRPHDVDAGQPRARLRRARVRCAGDRALVLRR